MVGSEFLGLASTFALTSYAGLEDFADKLNFLFTVVLLLLCVSIVTVKQYVLKPISCYIATDVGGKNLLDYVENYCWVQGTVPISYKGHMPNNQEEWASLDSKKILYYQWVPFVLGLQCILFYLPRMFWQIICASRAGANLEHIVKKSVDAVHAKPGNRQALIEEVAANIEYILFQMQEIHVQVDRYQTELVLFHYVRRLDYDMQQKRLNLKTSPSSVWAKVVRLTDESLSLSKSVSRQLLPLSRSRGNHIIGYYLFIKVLYLVVAIGELFLMQAFLGFKTNFNFGFVVLQNIINGHDWETTLTFPRVGFCYVQMRNLGVNSNGVTAQCALPVNMLNEKIFMFVWWWIAFTALITLVSLLVWMWRLFGCSDQSSYVTKYIELADDSEPYNEMDVTKFTSLFLRSDGMFMVRMIRFNVGDVITASIVNCLWQRYLQRKMLGDRDPRSNVLLSQTGYDVHLEKGGKTDEDFLHKRKDKEVPPKSAYPKFRNGGKTARDYV